MRRSDRRTPVEAVARTALRHRWLWIVLGASLAAACAACNDKTDEDFRADVSASMHTSITQDLSNLVSAVRSLQAMAPNRAWNPETDRAAINDMQTAWKRARTAWEHVEGAIAPEFAGFNVSMDARYEDFLTGLGGTGDPNLFDATGVVGMHAIERILFAAEIRPEIVAFERDLPGYKPAAYPATDHEAIAFKTQLVQRLIDDTSALGDAWLPADVDIGSAYAGLVSLMDEQQEKVNLAVSGEEESRYANVTLFDLRNNLDGTQKAYDLFREWILSKAAAEHSDHQIIDKFGFLMNTYKDGDSLPTIPENWSSEGPTEANLHTDFGKLWQNIHTSVDPNSQGSVVFEMNQVAAMLGFPKFVEQ